MWRTGVKQRWGTAYLRFGLSFGDIVTSHFDLGLEEGLGHGCHGDPQQVTRLLGNCNRSRQLFWTSCRTHFASGRVQPACHLHDWWHATHLGQREGQCLLCTAGTLGLPQHMQKYPSSEPHYNHAPEHQPRDTITNTSITTVLLGTNLEIQLPTHPLQPYSWAPT